MKLEESSDLKPITPSPNKNGTRVNVAKVLTFALAMNAVELLPHKASAQAQDFWSFLPGFSYSPEKHQERVSVPSITKESVIAEAHQHARDDFDHGWAKENLLRQSFIAAHQSIRIPTLPEAESVYQAFQSEIDRVIQEVPVGKYMMLGDCHHRVLYAIRRIDDDNNVEFSRAYRTTIGRHKCGGEGQYATSTGTFYLGRQRGGPSRGPKANTGNDIWKKSRFGGVVFWQDWAAVNRYGQKTGNRSRKYIPRFDCVGGGSMTTLAFMYKGGEGIHGTNCSLRKKGRHYISWLGANGSLGSHGCLRSSNEAMIDMLYNIVETGTRKKRKTPTGSTWKQVKRGTPLHIANRAYKNPAFPSIEKKKRTNKKARSTRLRRR